MKFYLNLRNGRGEAKDANAPSTKTLTKRGEVSDGEDKPRMKCKTNPLEKGNRIMTSKFRFLRGRLSVFSWTSGICTKGDL
jgi:hypothetical protein